MQVAGAALTLVLFSSNYIAGGGFVIVFADEYLTGSWKYLLRNKRSSTQPTPLWLERLQGKTALQSCLSPDSDGESCITCFAFSDLAGFAGL